MYIIIDQREQDVLTLIDSIQKKYNWKKQTITHGDYAIVLDNKDIIVFERKTKKDLKSSRIDARIENLHNLSDFKYKYLILEGIFDKTDINMMSLRYRIPILLTDGPLQTIKLIEKTATGFLFDTIDTKFNGGKNKILENNSNNLDNEYKDNNSNDESNNNESNEHDNEHDNEHKSNTQITDLEKLSSKTEYHVPIGIQLLMLIPGIKIINATKLYKEKHTLYSLYLKRNLDKIKLRSPKAMYNLKQFNIKSLGHKILMTLPGIGAKTADKILKYYNIETLFKNRGEIATHYKSNINDLMSQYTYELIE